MFLINIYRKKINKFRGEGNLHVEIKKIISIMFDKLNVQDK